MPIKVTCSHCGVTLSTPDSSAGKTGKCPKCSSPLEIPASNVENDVLDAEDSLLAGLDEEALTAGDVSEEQRQPCSACGELIVRGAVKCRYCGEIFDPLLKKQEQKKIKKASAASSDAKLSAFEVIVAIFCSGIGCICGIIWLIQGNPKGKKMLLISLGVQLIGFVIGFLAELAKQAQ